MATLLETGLLNLFLPVFIFILVFAIFYGLLKMIPLFGDNAGVNLLIAFAMALLLVLLPGTLEVVRLAIPWFVVFVIMVILIFMLFLFMGVKPEEMVEFGAKNTTVITVVISVVVLIFLWSISKVYGPIFVDSANCASGVFCSIKTALYQLRLPRILGALFILIIASYAIRAIAPVK